MIATTATRTGLSESHPLTHHAGRVTITLSVETIAGAPLYRVETYQSMLRLDGWCASYGDETTARSEARRAAYAFDRFEDARSIELHADALRNSLNRLIRDPRGNRHLIATTERDLAGVENLHEAQQRHNLTDLTQPIAA